MLRVIVLASVLALQVLGSPVNIPSSLDESLQSKGTVDVFLSLESPQPILSQLKARRILSRAERKSVVAGALKSHAEKSQKSLLAFLSAQPQVTVKSFWISNEVYVKGADGALISKLRARSEVLNIREELKEEKILPAIPGSQTKHMPNALEWGVDKIGAQAVWDAGFNGNF